MTMVVIQTTPARRKRPTLLKVAAYCRVSEITDRTEHSYAAQIAYYQQLITSTTGWQYVGVYADHGISGTSTEHRDGFNQMMADARAGKIDLILTKSISRLARNTVDLLNTVRELTALDVEVRFSKERISTATADGEFLLTLLASFAQAESEQISTNIRWAVKKRFEEGRANGFHLYGYTSSADATDVEIIEDEATVVRWIYQQYMQQVSCERMHAMLHEGALPKPERGFPSIEGIRLILRTKAYTGDLTLGTWTRTTRPIGRSKPNDGTAPTYLVAEAIPAIISHDQFEAVQAERARRRALGAKANIAIPTSCFTSRITCGDCGQSVYRSGKRSTDGIVKYVWICSSKREPKRAKRLGITCHNKAIPEIILQEVCTEILGLDEFDPVQVEQRISKIMLPEANRITFHMTDGRSIERTWHFDLKTRCWTEQRRKAWGKYQTSTWTPQRRKEHGEQTRARSADPEWKRKRSERMRALYADPEYKQRWLELNAQAAAKRAQNRKKNTKEEQ